MSEIIKQGMADIWASSGDIVAPDAGKVAEGWLVEVVPRQYWNWMQNRTDVNLAYMLQHGIPEWDTITEFIANKSYVQHAGIVYKAILTGINQNPVTATTYWEVAFATSTAALEALKATTPATDKLPYFSSSSTATTTTLTSLARSLLDDTTQAAMLTTIGAQPVDATLTALAGVTTATNKLPYFSGSDTAAVTDLTAFGRSLIDDVDAASARSTLELVKTTSPTDTTAGRMLKVGDFGLGGIPPILSGVNVNDVQTAGSTYWCDSCGNTPNGSNGWLVVKPRTVGSFSSQIFTEVYGGIWVRAIQSGTWQPWKEVWTSGNLVKQANASDNTAGSVLITGAHNLGVGAFAKNKIINGDFRVWQRGGVFTPSNTQYTADRWRSISLGASPTVDSGNYANLIAIFGVAGNTSVGISQPIEALNSYDLAGKTVTISLEVDSDTYTAGINVNLFRFTTKDTTSSSTFVGSVVFTGPYVNRKLTATISVPANATLGLYLEIVTSSGHTSGVITIKNVQLEVGSVATPFESRPYGQELALCQRYYEMGGGNSEGFFCGDVTSGGAYYYGHTFQVAKRTAPTITLTSQLASGFPSTASSFQGVPTIRGFATVRTSNATVNGGFYADSWTASSEL